MIYICWLKILYQVQGIRSRISWEIWPLLLLEQKSWEFSVSYWNLLHNVICFWLTICRFLKHLSVNVSLFKRNCMDVWLADVKYNVCRNDFLGLGQELDHAQGRDLEEYYDILEHLRKLYRQHGEVANFHLITAKSNTSVINASDFIVCFLKKVWVIYAQIILIGFVQTVVDFYILYWYLIYIPGHSVMHQSHQLVFGLYLLGV